MATFNGTQRFGTIQLTINGRTVKAAEGESLLDCALRHGISIPHLCTLPNLPAFGACRMCLVEIEGQAGFLPSCTTPARAGMEVRTETPALRNLRRHILELMMLEHPSACLVCGKKELCEEYRPEAAKAGRTTGCHTCNNKTACELRGPADRLGPLELPVPPLYRDFDLERSNPFIDRDLNLCILCGRCTRICKEQHETATITFIGRGTDVRIGEAFGRSLLEAGCRFCGSCVDVCPTGALADRYAKWQKSSGERAETTCMLCDEACALSVEVSVHNRAVGAQAVNDAIPVCVLGRFAIPEFLSGSKRLAEPMIKMDSVLRKVGWKDALDRVTEQLASYRGERIAVVGDSSGTLEDRAIREAFALEAMGTPHYIDVPLDDRGRPTPVTLPEGVKAVLLAGAFVDPAALDDMDLVIVLDCYPSPVSERADVVLPVATLAEVQGTWLDRNGVPRPVRKVCDPPGKAWPEWKIISTLAREMGVQGFAYDSVDVITRERLGIKGADLSIFRDKAPAAARDPALRRTHFRGHDLAQHIRGLRELPLSDAVPEMAVAGD